MEAEDLADTETLHHAVGDHLASTAAAFFGGLEDDSHGAAKIPRLAQMACRAQEHRGVAVMPAGMHEALNLRGIGKSGRFDDRQRIHVGPKADHRDLCRDGRE